MKFTNYSEWVCEANKLGWVHCHDNLVVVDDPDTGECLGEWDGDIDVGFISYD